MKREQSKLIEKIKANTSKVQKEVELNVAGRLRKIESRLSKQAIKANKVKQYIEEITSRLELIPNNGKEAEQVISSLEELMNDCTKDCHKELQPTSNELEIPSYFIKLKKPELGLELIQQSINKQTRNDCLYSKSMQTGELQSSELRKNRSVIAPTKFPERAAPIIELVETSNASPLFGGKKDTKRTKSERALTTRISQPNIAKVEDALKCLGKTMRGIGEKHTFNKAEEYILHKLK